MDDLKKWVEKFLPAGIVVAQPLKLTEIAGDAGFRKYYRTSTKPGLIAVLAPPEHANNLDFIRKQNTFRRCSVPVPHVYAVNFKHGFMLQEDLGDIQLLSVLSAEQADNYYGLAEDILLRIQQMPLDRPVFPDYSYQELLRELEIFPEWFLGKLLGMELSDEDRVLLSSTFRRLIDSALEQPQVIVHRDFHARNLMLCPSGGGAVRNNKEFSGLAVIDFQDAVIGPVTYDLVSLLRDCYIRWPVEFVLPRVEKFREKLEKAGVVEGVSSSQFIRWFDLMGLQRHIKVLGIFSRLWLRDCKPQYLNDLPLVLRYTIEQIEKYPELSAFAVWLRSRVLPLLPNQKWYRPWEQAGE